MLDGRSDAVELDRSLRSSLHDDPQLGVLSSKSNVQALAPSSSNPLSARITQEAARRRKERRAAKVPLRGGDIVGAADREQRDGARVGSAGEQDDQEEQQQRRRTREAFGQLWLEAMTSEFGDELDALRRVSGRWTSLQVETSC